MSEEQGKRNDKWNDHRSFMLFTILLFVILAVLFCFTYYRGWHEEPIREPAYTATKDDFQYAVNAYRTNHNQSFPILNGTYTNFNCSHCNVINISDLLAENGGMLRESPDGLNLSTSGNDNCGGNESLGCVKGNHYIWVVDTYGTVYSYCTGARCETNNSGYQGVWP